MNNYLSPRLPESASVHKLSTGALLIGLCLSSSAPLQISSQAYGEVVVRPAKFARTESSYSSRSTSFTGAYDHDNFEQTVALFYEKFLALQEPLGEEFEKVLTDNFLDWLVRT